MCLTKKSTQADNTRSEPLLRVPHSGSSLDTQCRSLIGHSYLANKLYLDSLNKGAIIIYGNQEVGGILRFRPASTAPHRKIAPL